VGRLSAGGEARGGLEDEERGEADRALVRGVGGRVDLGDVEGAHARRGGGQAGQSAQFPGGEAAGEGLTALLRPHILIAAEIVKAAKAGDAAAVGAANARWSANADEIADFLHKANPQNWPQATLRAEMHHHLDLTLQEATARIKGDWAADIAAYDKVHDHILGMADVLSAGIVRQFPRKFRQ